MKALRGKFKVNGSPIVNKMHPEWGTWRVIADKGDWYEIQGRGGARVLFKNESQDWREAEK